MALTLTVQQIAFFRQFGYLHLPGILGRDMGWIAEEYEAVYRAEQHAVVPIGGANADGTHWASTINHLFVSMSPRLSTMIEDPRIVGICTALLGAGYSVNGGDGTLFHTNTGWHPDTGEIGDEITHIKISCYLDPLTRGTGALRVIPGSHAPGPRREALRAAVRDPVAELGAPGEDLPSVACETQPGDLVVFDHRTLHASFGGARRRRLMCLNAHGALDSARKRDLMLAFWREILRQRPEVGWYPGFIESSPPERLQHLRTSVELLAQARREPHAAASGA